MAPAGFKGDEIRALFTGVSQAAATFGMSADKVDRVNYAFAQMASKGQVMSEELKGQLGDVLPGAMGIFAKAAGFEGADAIQKFGKALEDGAYKGKPMRDLLKNVTIELQKEFGPGAEGAARTYQGAMNRMANSTRLLYEAFEPVAVGFLNSVVVPLTSGIKTITDGFNAFFTGAQAKTSGGMAFAQELERLKPAFDGIRTNVAALMPVLQGFGKTLLEIGKIALQIAGNPLVGYLGRLYLIVLPINMALGILRGLWASNALQLLIFNARVATGTSTLTAFRGMTAATGVTAAIAAGQIRGFGLALRAALATTVVGLAVVGLGMIAEAFMTAGAKADAARQKMSQFMDSVKQLGAAGDVVGATAAAATEKASATRIKQAEALLTQLKAGKKTVSDAEMKELRALGLASNMQFVQEKGQKGLTVQGMFGAVDANIKAAQQGYLETQTRIVQSTNAIAEAKKNQVKQETELQKIDTTGVGGDSNAAADKAAKEAARLASQQQQNSIDAANRQNALNQAITEGMMTLDDQAFQHRINLIDARNNYELAGLNSIEARQEKFQQDLQKIELDRINTVRKAQQEVQKASLQYAAAQNTAAASQGGTAVTGQIDKSVLRDWLISQGFGRTKGDFTNKGHATPNHMLNAMDMGILGGSDADALRKTADMEKKLRATGAFGSQLFGPTSDPYGHGAGKGGQNIHLHIPTPGGKVNMTPGLSSLMGKSGAVNTMQRREDKAGGRLVVEQQQLSNQQIEAGIVATNAANEALAQRKTLIASNINTIFPVAEQRLENDLMKIRNQLQLQGMPQEYIDYQESSYKGAYESAQAIATLKEETVDYGSRRDALQAKQAKGVALTQQETVDLKFYTEAIKQNDGAVVELTEKQKQYQIVQLEGALATMKNTDALKAQQETMSLIKGSVESATSSYKGFMKEVITGGDPTEALKKFQEAITDQVLTIFLDFAMKPVEDMLKNQLSALFGIKTEEQAREEAVKKMEDQLKELKASKDCRDLEIDMPQPVAPA
jgi:tape measure domain-containing protein